MTEQSRFRPDIEGLRAIAVLLVLLYHAQIPGFRGGFLGVDVFFVLSGFLITQLLLEEAARTGRIDFREFYARRIRRLLPASVLVLGATAIAVRWLLPITSWRDFGGDVAASAAYVVNWRFAARAVDYLAEDVGASPVQHFWSLAVEEQFYLLWPLLVLIGIWLARRVRWSQRVAVGVVLTVVVAVPSFVWSIVLTGSQPATAFFVTTTRLWELAMGALVAIALPRIRIRSEALRLGMQLMGVVVIVGIAAIIDTRSAWPGAWAAAPTLATAAMIVAGTHAKPDDLIQRVLSLPTMQWMGARSYSLYLWHWPPVAILAARWGRMSTAQASLIVAASFVPAWLSHRLVENPLRYRPTLKRSARRSIALGAGLSAAGVAAGLALVLATPTGTRPAIVAGAVSVGRELGAGALTTGMTETELLTALRNTTAITPHPAHAVNDLPQSYADGCQATRQDVKPVICRYGVAGGRPHIALIGDSKIIQWEPALITIAQRNRWDLTTITKSACELSTAMPNWGIEPYPECRQWVDEVLAYLATDPPDLALISQVSGNAWIERGGPSGSEGLIVGMIAAYEAVRALGARVVIMIDTPHPPAPVYECVAEHPNDLEACAYDRDEAVRKGARPVQLEVVARGGYDAIDMLDLICPTATCLPVIGDVLVYRQGSHLTATYVESMAEELGRRLMPLLPGSP